MAEKAKLREIEFNTGRFYSKEGQIIKAVEYGTLYEDLNWFNDEDIETLVQFVEFDDTTRGIKGRIKFCRLTEEDIMRQYDLGNYQNI